METRVSASYQALTSDELFVTGARHVIRLVLYSTFCDGAFFVQPNSRSKYLCIQECVVCVHVCVNVCVCVCERERERERESTSGTRV